MNCKYVHSGGRSNLKRYKSAYVRGPKIDQIERRHFLNDPVPLYRCDGSVGRASASQSEGRATAESYQRL